MNFFKKIRTKSSIKSNMYSLEEELNSYDDSKKFHVVISALYYYKTFNKVIEGELALLEKPNLGLSEQDLFELYWLVLESYETLNEAYFKTRNRYESFSDNEKIFFDRMLKQDFANKFSHSDITAHTYLYNLGVRFLACYIGAHLNRDIWKNIYEVFSSISGKKDIFSSTYKNFCLLVSLSKELSLKDMIVNAEINRGETLKVFNDVMDLTEPEDMYEDISNLFKLILANAFYGKN